MYWPLSLDSALELRKPLMIRFCKVTVLTWRHCRQVLCNVDLSHGAQVHSLMLIVRESGQEDSSALLQV